MLGQASPLRLFWSRALDWKPVRAELAALFKNKRLSMGVAQNHDLLIVHLMLPELSGTELISRLRRHNTTVPIIVLTARDAVDEPWRKPAFSPE
jgi:DNA-binding response OmpR family regulator